MHDCAIDQDLQAKGLRKTADRHRLLELFQKNRAWTAAEVRQALGDVDLSTVYRNLRRLVKEELLSIADVPGNEEHFERITTAHHDHQRCDTCATVECLPCPAPNLPTHQLQLKTRCTACA